MSSDLHTEGHTCDHAFTSTQVPARRCLCLINDPASGPSPSQHKRAKTATSVWIVVVVFGLVWFAVAGGGVAVGGQPPASCSCFPGENCMRCITNHISVRTVSNTQGRQPSTAHFLISALCEKTSKIAHFQGRFSDFISNFLPFVVFS